MMAKLFRGVMLILFGAFAGMAGAQNLPALCAASTNLIEGDTPLPHLARRLGSLQPALIVVIGTSSAAGAGVSSPANAFPIRLERELTQRYPKARISVQTIARAGIPAIRMEQIIESQVLKMNPALVIWQTGSADASRSVALQEFGAALDRGLEALQRRQIDAILMNMQYSPYTDAFVNSRPYRTYMQWMASRYEAPLFQRYEIMQQWSEKDMLDLRTTDKMAQIRNADMIHQCIAALLADMIDIGIKAAHGN